MFQQKTLVRALVAAAFGCAATSALAVDFVNGLALPGAALDASGGTSVNNGRLGYFSDIYYDPNAKSWWGLSDRGPGGGTISYDTRVQRFNLNVNGTTGAISGFSVAETVKFKRADGSAFNGLAPNPANVLGNAFDPEGIVVNPRNGNLIVSDEYGPSVYEFNPTGTFVRAYNTPAGLVPKVGGVDNFAAASPDSGRRGNRGFEGLAISADGNHAYAMLQSSTMQEGGSNGVYNRIVKFDTTTGDAVAQYAYQMDTASQGRGISALVAIGPNASGDDTFLVLERNNRGLGVDSTLASPSKKIYEIAIGSTTTDVTGIDLDAPGASFTKVVKNPTAFIDLATNTLDALGNLVPEKWEGLTIGPKLADGSYVIVAGTDNDYSVTQNAGAQFDVYTNNAGTRAECALDVACAPAGYYLIPGVLHAYKASALELANYSAPVPEPSTYAMLAAGLLGLGATLRRRR